MMTKSCHYTAEISQNYEVSGPVSRSFFYFVAAGGISVSQSHLVILYKYMYHFP